MVNFKNFFNNESPIGLRSMGLSSKALTNKNTPVKKKTTATQPQVQLFTSTAKTQTNTMRLNFTPRNVENELNSLFGRNTNLSFENKMLG